MACQRTGRRGLNLARAQADDDLRMTRSVTATAPAAPRGRRPPLAELRTGTIVLTAATLALAVLVAAVQGSLTASVLRAVLVVVLVPCAVIDLRSRIIPNRITGPAAIVAIALGTALDPGGEWLRLLWMGICGGFLLITALIYPAGMGMGDVKLIAVMALLLGPLVLVALMFALAAQVVAAVVIAARHGIRRARKTTLAFGPFLAGSGIAAALIGATLLRSYLSLHG
jgi:leader peptidase (prepilin peptidase)/N-methyltransferase